VDKQSKKKLSDIYFKDLTDSFATVLVNYRGLAVKSIDDLRFKLREVDSLTKFFVVKNRVFCKSLEKSESHKVLKPYFKGPIAVMNIKTKDFLSQNLKVLIDFEAENKKIKIVTGFLDNNIFDYGNIVKISKLPSKEVLISQALSCFCSPHRNLFNVLNGVQTKLIRVINAIRDQKSKK
jgi:large subunit ribosomal protein L10